MNQIPINYHTLHPHNGTLFEHKRNEVHVLIWMNIILNLKGQIQKTTFCMTLFP